MGGLCLITQREILCLRMEQQTSFIDCRQYYVVRFFRLRERNYLIKSFFLSIHRHCKNHGGLDLLISGKNGLGMKYGKNLVFLLTLSSSLLCIGGGMNMLSSPEEQHWLVYFVSIVLSGITLLIQVIIILLFDFLNW